MLHGVPDSGAQSEASLRQLLDSKIACEIRTTVHPRLLDSGALCRMADELAGLSVQRWILQPFRLYPDATLAAELYKESVLATLQACKLPAAWR